MRRFGVSENQTSSSSSTHSAELISSSLDESVIFLTPPKEDGGNQAVKIEPTGDVAEALHQLGQSLGVVSLGKKIVLIEGSAMRA